MLAHPAGIGSWTYVHTVAACAAMAAAATSLLVAPNAQGLFGSGLAVLMAAIAAIDARDYIIPDELNAAAFMLALTATVFQSNGAIEEIASTGVRAIALALAFLALRQAYGTLRRRDGIGLGDVKLAGVAGAWLTWQTIPIAVEIAALAALAAYAAHRYLAGRPFQAAHRLPFGLFFAPAIWFGWLLDTFITSDISGLTQLLPAGLK